MHLRKPVLTIYLSLILTACSSGGEQNVLNPPVLDDPATGGITVDSNPRPVLASLPDVEFEGYDEEDGGTATSPSAIESTDGGGSDGGTDAGSSTGGADGGSGTTGGATSDDSVGGRESSSSDSTTGGSGDVPPGGRPNGIQPGTLTAADYDDHLNPHLYQKYASDYLQSAGKRIDTPHLDFSKRIQIHVTDINGGNYQGAKLFFYDSNGQFLSLTTPASGITSIYNNLDLLPPQFEVLAEGKYGASVSATIKLEDADKSGRIHINIPEDHFPLQENGTHVPLDLMFVIDTTGSMGDELGYLQTELNWIINQINHQETGLRIGLIVYRDLGDEYVVRSYGLTEDVSRMAETLRSETYDGGGDYPEAMDQALHQAVDANWQDNSHKVIFLIADAPPHLNKMRATWNAAEQARLKNIHVAPVAASGVGADAEYIMRSMAALTNSRYLFLTDDSGLGNPHAEPDIDCYIVTALNDLMVRVVNSLVSGIRHEPSEQDVIRKVGSYNNGVCGAQTQQQ